tara:strand:+ start:556 stop:738 length:183 start_codon:yes stop_codon:yes gene_type:complete
LLEISKVEAWEKTQLKSVSSFVHLLSVSSEDGKERLVGICLSNTAGINTVGIFMTHKAGE